MKRWSELHTKSGKAARLARVIVSYEIRHSIEEKLKEYEIDRSETILNKIRDYLIENNAQFSNEARNTIDIWLK